MGQITHLSQVRMGGPHLAAFDLEPAGGVMGVNRPSIAERARAERIRALSRRCRDLSEMTAIPEVTRELLGIAQELENEAELVTEK